jgi:hypothetical protein
MSVQCGYTILIMNRLTIEKRVQVISALVEGNSLRSVVRMTGVALNTIQKLLADLGKACTEYQDKAMRNLTCKHIQCDEIWQFCYAKDKNVPADKQGQFGYGSVWTWVALDADTKLVPSWCIGTRGAGTAFEFIHDLAERLAHRIQLTTDGHRVYLEAIESAFGSEIDYPPCSSSYTAQIAARAKHGTARQSALDAVLSRLQAGQTQSTSRLALWNVKISQCACLCGASPA